MSLKRATQAPSGCIQRPPSLESVVARGTKNIEPEYALKRKFCWPDLNSIATLDFFSRKLSAQVQTNLALYA